MAPEQAAPPPRPPPWEERIADALLRLGSPRLERIPEPEPPQALAPFERLLIARPSGGILDATRYPATREARGVVVMGHPWLPYGQAYFHRRGRVEALREAGYHVLTFDLAGFGRTNASRRFREHEVEDALRWANRRASGLPVHYWGVSAGGYWAFPVLAREKLARGAFFEEVSPHLMEWTLHTAPSSRAGVALARRAFPRAHRYLDMRRHAPHLRVEACAVVGSARDRGVPERDTRELARLARAECLVVVEADHLDAIRLAGREVIALALRTFAKAEQLSRVREPASAAPP